MVQASTLENERARFRGRRWCAFENEGLVLSNRPQKRAYAARFRGVEGMLMLAGSNRPHKRAYVVRFEGGGSADVGKEQPPSKTSHHARFRGRRGRGSLEVLARSNRH